MVFMSQHFPKLPPLVPQRGTASSRALCQKLFIAQGWQIQGEIPNLAKAVAIVSPHTSNIDAWYGFLAVAALGLKITVLGKDNLFKRDIIHLSHDPIMLFIEVSRRILGIVFTRIWQNSSDPGGFTFG